MSERTYSDREDAAGQGPGGGVPLDVDSLVALAGYFQVHPATLLLPDEDQVDADSQVEIKALHGGTLGHVSARDYGLWVLGLLPLPWQQIHRFDLMSRVTPGSAEAKTVRGIKAGALDPWPSKDHSDPLELADYSSLGDVALGSRAISACRRIIRTAYAAEVARRAGATNEDDEVAGADQELLVALAEAGDMLAEIGRRQAHQEASPT
jgi:hypothetical protein